MIYRSLSSRERRLLEEVESRNLPVFSPLEASKILGVNKDAAYRALSRLEDKGVVFRIERGKYIIGRFLSERDIYEIAPFISQPSYISLWSGLHYYGLTGQVPRDVFLMVTRSRRGLSLQGQRLRFVRVRREMFFGYRLVGGTVVAEKEKLLIDCLAFPAYAGGVGNLTALAGDGDMRADRLVEYAVLSRSGTICSRLGYLLEHVGADLDDSRLLPHVSASRVLLDPSGPREARGSSAKWNVLVNVEV